MHNNLGNKKRGGGVGFVPPNLIGSDGVIRYPRGIFLDSLVDQLPSISCLVNSSYSLLGDHRRVFLFRHTPPRNVIFLDNAPYLSWKTRMLTVTGPEPILQLDLKICECRIE